LTRTDTPKSPISAYPKSSKISPMSLGYPIPHQISRAPRGGWLRSWFGLWWRTPPRESRHIVMFMPLVQSPWRFDPPHHFMLRPGADYTYLSHPQVLTGLLPFPLRKHDHGVTVDILAGQKPSHCASMICIGVLDSHAPRLCDMMESCWHREPLSRPSMSSICQYLSGFTLANSPTPPLTTS
jgi:hypothetical protein